MTLVLEPFDNHKLQTSLVFSKFFLEKKFPSVSQLAQLVAVKVMLVLLGWVVIQPELTQPNLIN